MQLTKHHGLGNDFLVVLDEVNGRALKVDGELARKVCDRRTGVGADGLIHGAAPEPGSNVDVVMHLYNADGSRAEMSGNGIRCLGQAVALAREVGRLTLLIQTDAGVHHVDVRSTDADDRRAYAEATVGKIRPGPEVPPAVVARLADPGPAHAFRSTTADIGNPHLVVEVEDPDKVDLADVGPWIERQFPEGINVEFIGRSEEPERTDVDMRVWERGAGATQACGTGACAVAAAVADWDAANPIVYDRTITVHMPGGDAKVVLQDDGMLLLCGDVQHVATIELPDD